MILYPKGMNYKMTLYRKMSSMENDLSGTKIGILEVPIHSEKLDWVVVLEDGGEQKQTLVTNSYQNKEDRE